MAYAGRYRRPNYFVAFQITDKSTVSKLVKGQADIISKYPRYAEYKVPENGFHLTLAVMSLDTVADKQACTEAMEKARPEIEFLAKKTKPLVFEGLDHFNTKVIFAKIKYSKEFLDVVDKIREVLGKAGVQMETNAFKPHLTLFNVKGSVFSRSWDRNSTLFLCGDAVPHFGAQDINNIQVCQMGTLPDTEGSEEFYQSIFKMFID